MVAMRAIIAYNSGTLAYTKRKKRMKKLGLLLLALALLAGCHKYTGEDYSAYKGMTGRQILDSAEKKLANQKYSAAAKELEALDALYPYSDTSQQGQLDIIYAYYMDDDTPSTIVACDRYIRLYPRGRGVDYAYYMKGLVLYKAGFTWLQRAAGVDPAPHDLSEKKQAFLAFNDLVRAFPNSQYAHNARLHMQYIRNLLARKQVEIAEYYEDRQAYVAAANRASYVVKHYNGTPAVKQALIVMIDSYRALGLNKLADNTLAILRANYPKDAALKRFS